ncbi:hypothetical protein [Bifidobacterium primatium]|uniref:hypothetical protein n=1 Tax=Bifidobacterium primatium TaxID=2045438 RepID=UPI001FAEA2F8|nr:hypothetical protein [Bifidobacterium primatium]
MGNIGIDCTQGGHERCHLCKHAFAESVAKVGMAQAFLNLMGEEDDAGFQVFLSHGAAAGIVPTESPHLMRGFMVQLHIGFKTAQPSNEAFGNQFFDGFLHRMLFP